MKLCLNCNKLLEGRKDKKFCNTHCKTEFHNSKRALFVTQFVPAIIREALKRNYIILLRHLKKGQLVINAEHLLEEGFQESFFTHQWKSSSDQQFQFVYDIGYHKTLKNNTKVYLVIRWEKYHLEDFLAQKKPHL